MNQNHEQQLGYAEPSLGDRGQRNDFFEVVPPTPFDFSHAHFDQSQHDIHHQNDDQHPNHLRPTAFRNHRSSSSTGSISSQISALSSNTSLTQWGSESDTHSEFAGSSFSGFAVDPKLFQAQVKEPTPEQECLTAKPEIKGPPAAKGKKRARTSTTQQDKEEKKKISHARKQHPEHIPRPRNAFILFRKHVVDSKLIPTSVEIRHQNVSIITAKMWSEAPAEQKAHFNDLAKIEKEEHLKKYPGYRYQPVYRRTNVVRRRVRKDAAEEEKCKSVAQLLMQGKSGEELAEEIKENGTKTVAKGVRRAPSKKGQANELSKGALRALRAQARQGGSGENSDLSRSVSRAVSPDPMLDETEDFGDFDSPAPSMLYMQESTGQPVLVPDQGYGQPTMSWGYQQPAAQQTHFDQSYAFLDQGQQYIPMPQQYQQQETYPSDMGSYGAQSQSSMDYGLPQPDFYAHDQALPFSPSSSAFGQVHTHAHAQPGPGPGPGPSVYRGMRDGVNDLAFPLWPEGIQSPTVAMGQQAQGHGLGGPSRPMSARWDRGFEGWGMGGEGALEGLGFEHDLMLNDYGSALAQADDMSVW